MVNAKYIKFLEDYLTYKKGQVLSSIAIGLFDKLVAKNVIKESTEKEYNQYISKKALEKEALKKAKIAEAEAIELAKEPCKGCQDSSEPCKDCE